MNSLAAIYFYRVVCSISTSQKPFQVSQNGKPETGCPGSLQLVAFQVMGGQWQELPLPAQLLITLMSTWAPTRSVDAHFVLFFGKWSTGATETTGLGIYDSD